MGLVCGTPPTRLPIAVAEDVHGALGAGRGGTEARDVHQIIGDDRTRAGGDALHAGRLLVHREFPTRAAVAHVERAQGTIGAAQVDGGSGGHGNVRASGTAAATAVEIDPGVPADGAGGGVHGDEEAAVQRGEDGATGMGQRDRGRLSEVPLERTPPKLTARGGVRA